MNRRKPTPLTLLFLTSHTRGDGETSGDDKMITTSKFRPHRKHDIFYRGGSQLFGLAMNVMVMISDV